MKTMLTTIANKHFSTPSLRSFASVFFMVSLLVAWQTAKAASPVDTTPASSKPAAPAIYENGAPTYTTKKATTLDGLMKEVYLNSPLNASILNKALVEANPKLLNGKANQNIQRGTTLIIPNHTQLVAQTLAAYAPPPMAAVSPPAEANNNFSSQSSDPSSRRLWVRFP
jgi:hypothetical protein